MDAPRRVSVGPAPRPVAPAFPFSVSAQNNVFFLPKARPRAPRARREPPRGWAAAGGAGPFEKKNFILYNEVNFKSQSTAHSSLRGDENYARFRGDFGGLTRAVEARAAGEPGAGRRQPGRAEEVPGPALRRQRHSAPAREGHRLPRRLLLPGRAQEQPQARPGRLLLPARPVR